MSHYSVGNTIIVMLCVDFSNAGLHYLNLHRHSDLESIDNKNLTTSLDYLTCTDHSDYGFPFHLLCLGLLLVTYTFTSTNGVSLRLKLESHLLSFCTVCSSLSV